MRRALALSLVTIVVLAVAITGCRPAAATKAPETFVLKFATFAAKGSTVGKPAELWAQEVERQTAGRVKVEIYFAGSLVSMGKIEEGVRTGIADGGFPVLGYTPDKFPLYMITDLPYLVGNHYAIAHALRDLYDNIPAVKEEFTRDNLIMAWPALSPGRVILSSKPILKLADMAGTKFQCAQRDWFTMLAAVGSVGVSMPGDEVYSATQRGVINGTAPSGIATWAYPSKVYELAPHLTVLSGTTMTSFATVINLDWWNKLPADLRQTIEAVNRRWTTEMVLSYIADDVVAWQEMEKRGAKFHYLPDEDLAKWKAVAEEIWKTRIDELEGKGLPAKQVLDAFLKFYKERGG